MSDLTPFDLLGPLPQGTTVLEASAGTGKTYAIAALVTRFVAEGEARLEEMLVITFGRMASQELRERVREQLVDAERGLADPSTIRPDDDLVQHLAAGTAEERAVRHRRVLDALAAFDAATIATTHQFCQLVLRSLGVAGDEDPRVELVERIDDLVVEVVDDLYLREYGDQQTAQLPRGTALALARAAVADPQAELVGNGDPERVRFTRLVTAEIERRKRKRGILTYDDLLSRLARALDADDAPARARMRARWKVVLVDEFQDTDPVQWDVLERAFVGHARLVLIGDPKQAIYAFRGGDIVTYLRARGIAGTLHTLPTNWRSDAPLVDALQVLTRGAALGDPAIAVHPIEAHRPGSRLAGLPHPAPFRLRLVEREDFPLNQSNAVGIDHLRRHIAEDLADDVAALLAARPTYDGRELAAGDVAVLLFSLANAPQIQAALKQRGIPSVINGGDNVLTTEAAAEWLALLEALEKPQFTGRIRSLALTSFVGLTPEELDRGGDDLTDDLAERVRGWLDLFRSRGLAAVRDALVSDGLVARVLSRPQGERMLTDLDHVGQVLHEVTHREGFGLVALLEWLRIERRLADKSRERTRRLDTDARAVQFVTLHGSKGLQYPIVYLPLAFNRSIWNADEPTHLFHEEGRRMLDISGRGSHPAARAEDAGEELRLTYVGLTRAQAQVVAWWAPSAGAVNSGLSRLLFERTPGMAEVQDRIALPEDAAAREQLERWQGVGAISLESSRRAGGSVTLEEPAPGALDHRRFAREIDTEWRRTSYSGLIRAEEQRATAVSEPEETGTIDEDLPDELAEDELPAVPRTDTGDAPLSPMEGLPAGATFGSLVHAVLEHADPQAANLRAELRGHAVEQAQWWSVDASPDDLADALLPMQMTSLGPLADGLRLVDLPLRDRLCELDFEFPLAGGEQARLPQLWLRQVADVLREHLPQDDPMRAYADKLENPSLGDQELRGYLSGSIDVVFRVPDAAVPGGHRFVVADYKTNRLGTPGEPLTALDYTQAAMTEAMLHSHYPLQALLYSVVLHRYLRWRLPDYDPRQHLGGVLYLYVRGMCGAETPVVDGIPCGVFTWAPPAALVTALSDLLAGEAVAA